MGPRYQHHSNHSGFEAFASRSQACLRLSTPVKKRFLSGRLGQVPIIGDIGWRIDQLTGFFTPRPLYSLGIFAIEMWVGFHMSFHHKALYHVLYGDSDVWLLGYLKRLLNHCLAVTFHDPSSILRWLEIDKIAKNFDAVILVSESQRDYFLEFFSPDRIFVVPHGVDTGYFQPPAVLSHRPLCLTVGSKLRDFETFASTIDLVLAAKSDVRFVAVGARRTDSSVPPLKHERVEFLDELTDEELLQVYQEAQLCVFPLLDGTANNALLEAMACGLPIVATDVGGIPEYLTSDAGILCPTHDSEAFANAILRVLGDRQLAKTMSAASRSRAVEFDFETVAREMDKVYDAIQVRWVQS